jgi:pimeloyl-ACP methyl ester carboxylesterase
MTLKRGATIALSLCALAVLGYFAVSKWAIRHETLSFHDILRDSRDVAVNIAVRRDRELAAAAELVELPVAIINHGNTVRFTEYSFLANALAARGYYVISIQHDLDSDGPMVTKAGEEYAGRHLHYSRGLYNILFAIEKLKQIQPNADYRNLTLVGHSNGGDISMYFAKRRPELVKRVVTLDNLRVPFLTDGRVKILSFRSDDPNFKPDPGVVPDDEACAKAGITLVKTAFRHNDFSDRGSDRVKTAVRALLDRFLDDDNTPPARDGAQAAALRN